MQDPATIAWEAPIPPEAKLLLLAIAAGGGRSVVALASRCGMMPRHALALGRMLRAEGYLDDEDQIIVIPDRPPDRADRGPAIPDRLKLAVLERDGYRCVLCTSREDPQVDHVHPRSLGGLNVMLNLQTLCGPCNRRKSDALPVAA